MNFTETDEQRALRKAVSELAGRYGFEYTRRKVKEGAHTDELWHEAGKLGFLGVNLPEHYGGGGGGMYELSLVEEELAAAGCSQLMMVVSPAICGTVIGRFGTEEQKQRWLPPIADGSTIMAFGITEPDAGSNSHKITTTARRDGSDWLLTGRKIYVSGVDRAEAILIVGRTADSRTGRLKPVLFAMPTDAPGFEYRGIEMDIAMTDKQFLLFMDDVRLPADALIGEEDAALAQLFAGLNPERIMAASLSVGTGRYALDKAVSYAKERSVWGQPIGAHQGLAHPLAQIKIELEQAKLMMQKAATVYDAGDDLGAGEAANMAKYAAAEVAVRAADQAVQTLGGNGFASEYGLGALLATARVGRVAPVSREMILNFVAQFSLGLPKSY
ncbi:MAG TPA: acyl-CoA dehydrogenase family protein [Jatrophihabitantaceae bacterium]|nr:acyl-CoA dehydrogenase family protein [Jatrophihabitantaceae bacterium]